jgi:DnaK suppressor protein
MRVSSRFDWQQQSRLLVERDRLRRLLADLRVAATSPGDYEPHDITDDEAALQADLIEIRLAATDTALERIEVGGYGFCSECASRIASERLEALPAAILCLRCAR